VGQFERASLQRCWGIREGKAYRGFPNTLHFCTLRVILKGAARGPSMKHPSRERLRSRTQGRRGCGPRAQATSVIVSAPASWQSRQRASYESSAPTTIVSPE
jgi:hypothetical protein